MRLQIKRESFEIYFLGQKTLELKLEQQLNFSVIKIIVKQPASMLMDVCEREKHHELNDPDDQRCAKSVWKRVYRVNVLTSRFNFTHSLHSFSQLLVMRMER